MMTILKKYSTVLYYSASFLLPFSIIVLVLLSQNIFWGSETTILASDGFHQYVIFAQNLRNILHGKDSIFYTFTSGLGLNFYALMSYYLGSFLSPFVYFFNLENMADAIYLFTIIKFGLIGLSSYFSLIRLYPKNKKIISLILSTSYALMSFAVSQTEIIMWLDVFMLLPLIILGLNRLMEKRKCLLYYVSLTILFIQNYYFGYMVAIFLTLYFLVQLTWQLQAKPVLRKIRDFTVVSILSTLSSSLMLLPTYLDLSTHGEEYSSLTKWLTDNSWYLDFFAKNIVGAYDTTKFGAIPMIYVGLFPLIFALLFFTIKSIKKSVRVAYAALFFFFIISFYLEPLDLLWQGMHAPNMFLHRYAWLLSFFIVLLAAESLSRISEITFKHYLFPLVFLAAGFGATLFFSSRYDFLQPIHFILTLAFLTAYAIILISFSKKQLPYPLMLSFTLLFTIFEISLNTYYQINALGNEWVFPSREGYQKNSSGIDSLVNYAEEQNNTFFRMERLLPQTGNDSMKFNYNGISQFSSIRNRASSSTLDRLGYKSDGTNLNLRYQNNTLIMDSLLGVKYNLSENLINKFGFTLLTEKDGVFLYENAFAAQLAFLTQEPYKNISFTVNTLDNQTKLLNRLTGLSYHYFNRLPAQMIGQGNSLGNRITISSENQMTTITYRVNVPEQSQLYVSMPNIDFVNDSSDTVIINANDRSYYYTTDNAYSFFDIGAFANEQSVDISFTFPENKQVSFDHPNFYALNLNNYQEAMTIINDQKVHVTTKANKVTARYSADQDSSLLFTIPYDKGWTAIQNGKKVKLSKAQNGFMKVNVSKGQGTVTLSFIPNGFKEGLGLSCLGLIGFVLYAFLIKKHNRTGPRNGSKSNF
ncbi:YfhO family protein [Streptococcus huangxiaojuni]|uniref:YfhO family protein n=1 Tax=Streptococcus huangxiaojuni TaxID=3237239 RepID=UPI003F60D167